METQKVRSQVVSVDQCQFSERRALKKVGIKGEEGQNKPQIKGDNRLL